MRKYIFSNVHTFFPMFQIYREAVKETMHYLLRCYSLGHYLLTKWSKTVDYIFLLLGIDYESMNGLINHYGLIMEI